VGARHRIAARSEQAQKWAEERDPASWSGVAVDAWRRYRAVDGPLQSALLSLYLLVAVMPALLVIEEYFDASPAALAAHLTRDFGLDRETRKLLFDVLSTGRTHELGSALFAIVGALFFGLGFGRVLQLVHARAWHLDPAPRVADQALYAGVLLGLYGLLLLLIVQLNELRGGPSWAGKTLAIGWAALLVAFFTWSPWLLLHRRIGRRELLPGAALTAIGLVLLMLVSQFVMGYWVDLYATDYGGLGVVLAIYFWIAFSSFVIVASAALGPALARRRGTVPGVTLAA
jgi:membrane protein